MSLWVVGFTRWLSQAPATVFLCNHMIMKMQTPKKPYQTNKANEKCFAIRLNDFIFFMLCLRNIYPLTHTHTLGIKQHTSSSEMNTILWFFDFHRTENLKAVHSLSLTQFSKA